MYRKTLDLPFTYKSPKCYGNILFKPIKYRKESCWKNLIQDLAKWDYLNSELHWGLSQFPDL